VSIAAFGAERVDPSLINDHEACQQECDLRLEVAPIRKGNDVERYHDSARHEHHIE
jgi:hypothetical protein